MSAFAIRDAQWPQDRQAALGFIDGLQRFEKQFEGNRRVDATVAAEFFDVLMGQVADHGGIVRVAESGGSAAGWAVAWPEMDDVYVVAEERRFVYISELFVAEDMRGAGIGRALIASCEDWAKTQGIGVIQIGVLPGNLRAAEIYARADYAPYATRLRKYL
jgi:GNAT superfamily N-acetyltransferase